MNAITLQRPWYREPWPWLLMAGPAAVVVAGIATAVIAITTSDGVVADDYYKQGLAINRTLARDAAASERHLRGGVLFNEERTRVRLRLTGDVQPERLRLTLIHPTRAADQAIALAHVGGGLYEGGLVPPAAGKWHLRVEDLGGTWRLTGSWVTRTAGVTLEPAH